MDAPTTTHVATFETVLGRCAVRWTDRGITGVRLPDGRDRSSTSAADVPVFVRRAIAGMTAVLDGQVDTLRDVPIDDRAVDPFRRAVYAATRDIPPGTTRSYGEVARAIGQPERARDVGAALARNPTPIIVPCHRVVAADGKLTGFSAPGGLATKRRMLELEGAPGYGQQVLFR
jgi:methylated-DNA-[protein]-cysteine S-methyltransferase